MNISIPTTDAPATTLVTATVVGTAAALFVARKHGEGPGAARSAMQDVLVVFGLLVAAGAAMGGVKKADSVGRGLLWGAGGLAAAYGIDKALVRGKKK